MNESSKKNRALTVDDSPFMQTVLQIAPAGEERVRQLASAAQAVLP